MIEYEEYYRNRFNPEYQERIDSFLSDKPQEVVEEFWLIPDDKQQDTLKEE